ncbi:galactose mutarotase-like [Montipora capricornis]|uniref:galactose mutarotase-like n=1 Tax=Montipora capricornis TaxID=246305 RepID=UPI0035F14839
MVVLEEVFGQTESGEDVIKYTIKNSNKHELCVISLGATLVSLKCPDRYGNIDDVVLGYDTLEDYLKNPPYFGATIGRFANRIANAKFTLDGKEYQLGVNDDPNSLHGGFIGFNKKNWKSEVKGKNKVKFTCVSPDGDEGYPGEITASVTFTLNDDNEFKLNYKARTESPTIVNLTNHGYFNLAGQGERDVLDHLAQIKAPTYLPQNDVRIPTGEQCSVSSPNSAFDFLEPKPIGQDLDKIGGYDHTYCLPKSKEFLAEVFHPSSGRVLTMFTDQPGVQFYTANGLDGESGKGGVCYPKYGAFCLEAQNYPDAINQPNFPSPVLRPGEVYKQKTMYKLGVK